MANSSTAGRPRLPICLVASLLYLKHAFNLSGEACVERRSENLVWQYFSGLTCYTPHLLCGTTEIGRFRAAQAGAAGQALGDCAQTNLCQRGQDLATQSWGYAHAKQFLLNDAVVYIAAKRN